MTIGSIAKRSIQRSLRAAGLELRRFPRHSATGYTTIQTYSTYSPWLVDQEFLAVYEKIRSNTLVDRLRCYELWQLVGQVARLDGALIEIGVWRGGTGALIASRARSSGIKDPVFLCDTFKGVVKAGREDSRYKGGEHADTSEELVQQLVSSLRLNDVRLLKGIFPEATAASIADRKFRFCHIDVDVYQSAEDILAWIWDKLCIGACIVYDDYGFEGCDGITKHVDAQRELPDRVVIHNVNGHAIVVKTR